MHGCNSLWLSWLVCRSEAQQEAGIGFTIAYSNLHWEFRFDLIGRKHNRAHAHYGPDRNLDVLQ
jgi:hypothetical protein